MLRLRGSDERVLAAEHLRGAVRSREAGIDAAVPTVDKALEGYAVVIATGALHPGN